MSVALKRASCYVVAFGGCAKSRLVTANARSDVPLFWRRLVVVAPTRQWFRRWQSVECPTKSQWGAAWGQLCHALQYCKLVPAWDPSRGSRLGSRLGFLASTGRVQWTLESPAAVAGQGSEHGELGRYPAGTCTCRQQYGAPLAASAVSVAHPSNNELWHGHWDHQWLAECWATAQ